MKTAKYGLFGYELDPPLDYNPDDWWEGLPDDAEAPGTKYISIHCEDLIDALMISLTYWDEKLEGYIEIEAFWAEVNIPRTEQDDERVSHDRVHREVLENFGYTLIGKSEHQEAEILSVT